MVVTSGWYGLGHITPVTAVLEQLRKISDARISLFTLPFEVPRLERRGHMRLFDTVYVGADDESTDYQEYIIKHHFENRIRFHHAFHQERPDLILFHWMMLIETIDVACLSHCRVVALLEEKEWGYVVPGSPAARYFHFVDEVIFCDNPELRQEGLQPRQYRVGCVTDFSSDAGKDVEEGVTAHFGLPAALPLIVVNTAGGTYVRTHRYIRQLLSLIEQRPDLAFIVLMGPMFPTNLRHEIQTKAKALPNLAATHDPAREEIRCLINASDLVIHSGGVSSTAECIALRKKFLVINPVGSDHENDACRVHELVKRGICYLLEIGEESDIETLSQVIDQSLVSTQPLEAIPVDGAAQAAILLKGWLASPVDKAVASRSAIVCFFAPDVDATLRSKVKGMIPIGYHYLAIDLPAGALDCNLSMALELDRSHQLLDSLRPFKEVLLLAVTGHEPAYDRLLHHVQLPRNIFAVSLRPLALDPRFLYEADGDSVPPFAQELKRLLGENALCFCVCPPAPEHHNYVESGFSPFNKVR